MNVSNGSQHDERADLKEISLDLNFVPQWARKPPGESHYRDRDYDRKDAPDRRGERRPSQRYDKPGKPRRPRPENPVRDRRPAPPPPPRELPVSVSFLPEQKHLASLVRQIHHSRRAFPLMELAHLLIQDEEGYLVKIEAEKGASEFSMFQCNRCKTVACSEEVLIQHLLSAHLSDLYEKEEIETDPPTGQFVCVARCRKSGVLLGPPNHHSYIEKLNELHQARFAHMPLEEYKRSIETVRDEELIERWKQDSRKRTVYRLKSDPDAEPVDLTRAEADFMQRIPESYEKTQRAVIPSGVARSLDDRDITHAVRSAWTRENRFPLSMSFAMRAAFRHMHLHVFKAGRVNFVTHIKPHPIRPEDAVDAIAEVLLFLKEHPGSTRQHLLEELQPSLDPQSSEAKEALEPLGWLIERGHIIEFFNGTLAVPLGNRRR